jgi:hypothetical protein
MMLALALMPQETWAQAQGINTPNGSTTPLPIGAGGSTYINVMPGTSSTPGVVFFGSNATSKATAQAWIDATTGEASFALVNFTATGLTATGPMVLNNTLTVNNTATASSTAADLTVAHRIAAGSASGGNGGLQVGNGQLFGSSDTANFGMAWGSGIWGLLMNDGSGNVGIGTAPTTNKLDIGGQVNAFTYTASGGTTALTGQGIDAVTNLTTLPACSGTQALQKTGTNTFTCVSLTAGTATGNAALLQDQVMYNPTTTQMSYWDVPSQTWVPIAAAGGGGSYYGIQNLTMQPYGALVQSSLLTFNGNTPEPISISGPGSPSLSINGGAWVSSGTISKGQTLQLQAYAPFANAASETINFTTGSEQDTWSVSTANATYIYASYLDGGGVCSNLSGCPQIIYCQVGTACSLSMHSSNPSENNCNDNYYWYVSTAAGSNAASISMYNRCGDGGARGDSLCPNYGTGNLCGYTGMVLY